MKKPELLAPAGNLTKLKIALAYGADAVYASVGSFSLRQRSAREFTIDTFNEGIKLAHEKGAKFYATVNGFPVNVQIENIKKHLKMLGDLGVDGIIIATPGVINLAKEFAPNTQIHLSTQANVMNYLDANIYHQMGASRIVAAREMNLKDAVKIKEMVPNLEIEIFIHGSMCFAYSGRCLISAVQSGRFSNRGACANDCRFNYELYAKNEEKGTLFRIEEDSSGTYIMNSKDLNLSSYVEQIIKTNAIDSFKIEGRTKSEYYVACTTNAYRMAIDDAMAGKFDVSIYEKELATLNNRGFTDGYLVSRPFEKNNTQNLDEVLEQGTHKTHAITEDGLSFKSKGVLKKGVFYEIFAPQNAEILEVDNEIGRIYKQNSKFWLEFKSLKNENAKEFNEVHSGNLNAILSPAKLPEFSFLRKEN